MAFAANTGLAADRSTGTLLGSTLISADDEGLTMQIPLNQSGVDYVNSGAGAEIVFGGFLSSLRNHDQPEDETVFGSGPGSATLVVTTVPEPTGGVVLLCLSGFSVLVRRRR